MLLSRMVEWNKLCNPGLVYTCKGIEMAIHVIYSHVDTHLFPYQVIAQTVLFTYFCFLANCCTLSPPYCPLCTWKIVIQDYLIFWKISYWINVLTVLLAIFVFKSSYIMERLISFCHLHLSFCFCFLSSEGHWLNPEECFYWFWYLGWCKVRNCWTPPTIGPGIRIGPCG